MQLRTTWSLDFFLSFIYREQCRLIGLPFQVPDVIVFPQIDVVVVVVQMLLSESKVCPYLDVHIFSVVEEF